MNATFVSKNSRAVVACRGINLLMMFHEFLVRKLAVIYPKNDKFIILVGPYCEKMFTTKKGLVNHIGIHTGEVSITSYFL